MRTPYNDAYMRLPFFFLAVLLVHVSLAQAQVPTLQDKDGVYYSGPPLQSSHLLKASAAPCPVDACKVKQVVSLELVIQADGSVGNARIIGAPGPLDAAALDAIHLATFTPAKMKGTAVAVNKQLWIAYKGNGSPGRIVEKADRTPVPTTTPVAELTREQREHHVQGEVLVRTLVDAAGNVADAIVLSSPGAGLDTQALKAVNRYKFTPAKIDGQAVPVFITVAINFRSY